MRMLLIVLLAIAAHACRNASAVGGVERTAMVCDGPFDAGTGLVSGYADGGRCTTRYAGWACSPANYFLVNNRAPMMMVSMPVDGGCP